LREDRWTAGGQMMASSDANRWKAVEAAAELTQANASALRGCFQTAIATNKPQRCMIKIEPGPTP
jgi:hypothetical protein